MKYFFLPLMVFLPVQLYAQPGEGHVLKVAAAADSARYDLGTAFYLVYPDPSRREGFQLMNAKEYYFIHPDEKLPIGRLDSLYKTFDEQSKSYSLSFQYDRKGKKRLLAFTSRLEGQKIGLVIGGRLVLVATVVTRISSGVMTLVSNYSESQVDELQARIRAGLDGQ